MYPKPRDNDPFRIEREIAEDKREYDSLINNGPLVRPLRATLMSTPIAQKLDFAAVAARLETDAKVLESASDIVHYGGTCKRTFAADIRALIDHASTLQKKVQGLILARDFHEKNAGDAWTRNKILDTENKYLKMRLAAGDEAEQLRKEVEEL